jgi:hypothetical protein
LHGKANEAGEVGSIGLSFIFSTKTSEPYLRGGEAGGGEIDGGVLAGVKTILHDANEAVGEPLLLLKRALAAHVAVEREVSDRGVFGYTFTDVLQVEFGGVKRGLRGAEIVSLRVAEN